MSFCCYEVIRWADWLHMVHLVGTTERQLGFSPKRCMNCYVPLRSMPQLILTLWMVLKQHYSHMKYSVLIQGCFLNHEGHSFMVLPTKSENGLARYLLKKSSDALSWCHRWLANACKKMRCRCRLWRASFGPMCSLCIVACGTLVFGATMSHHDASYFQAPHLWGETQWCDWL